MFLFCHGFVTMSFFTISLALCLGRGNWLDYVPMHNRVPLCSSLLAATSPVASFLHAPAAATQCRALVPTGFARENLVSSPTDICQGSDSQDMDQPNGAPQYTMLPSARRNLHRL